MKSLTRLGVAVTLAVASGLAVVAAQGAGQLALENLWTIRTFSPPRWSPDSRTVATTVTVPETESATILVVGPDGKTSKIVAPAASPNADGTSKPTRPTLIDEPWSPDSRQLYYVEGPRILQADVGSGESRVLVEFGRPSKGYLPQANFNGPDPVLSPDGSRLAYIRESELWVLDIARGGVRQLTSTNSAGWHLLQPKWSPDSRRLLITAQTTGEQHSFPYPDFSKTVITTRQELVGYGRVRVGTIAADGGEPKWIGSADGEKYSLRGGSQVAWSPDGGRVSINRISLDHTARDLVVASATTGESKVIFSEKVDKWISPMAILARWSPDSRSLLVTSEEDGWNHLFVVPADGGAPRRLTSGTFTVTSNQVYESFEPTPAWSKDSQTIYFPSNEVATAERHLYAVPAAGGAWKRVTPLDGVDQSATVSPDGSAVAYLHSDLTTMPELAVHRMGGPAKTVTSLAIPPSLAAYRWRAAELVSFTNPKDGTRVAARLYTPQNRPSGQRLPAVVFVHGAGYTQSVYKGFVGGVDRAAFNHYLADRGYVVLDVDFRGSSGYGRKFMVDVHDRMGEVDVEDVVAGADYLKGLGYVDSARIGIWGHSYGGFMVTSALFRAPDVFAAGAAGAPVTDWERFFYVAPGYNEEHIGFPWANADGTRRASPLTHAGNLKNPLLLLSGVQDSMHLDSAALVNVLLEKRKPVDWYFYPNEAHGFRQPQAREDYYRRTAVFLDRYLRPERPASAP